MNLIENKINEDIHLKEYIYKKYSKKFYGYLKSTKAIFYVNNIEVDINTLLNKNDILKIKYLNKEKKTTKVNKEINILYEDEYLLIVDKESNLLTIPSRHEIDSIYSRVIFHRENDSINILTRLDKQTSGIVVISKKSYLVDKINILSKEYTTKTNNYLPSDEGTINLPIKKSDTIKRIISEDGKQSITNYKLIDKENYIYKLNLITGRTHQIRVHLSHYNCCIIGDMLYGGDKHDRLLLVCSKVKLMHPITNKEIEVKSNYGVI